MQVLQFQMKYVIDFRRTFSLLSQDIDTDHCPASERDKCVVLDCASGHRCGVDVQKQPAVNDAGARWGCTAPPERTPTLLIVHILIISNI